MPRLRKFACCSGRVLTRDASKARRVGIMPPKVPTMTLAPAKTRFTPDDLERLPDAVNYELVNGQLVERHMGFESSIIAGIVLTLLNSFVRPKRLGFVGGADSAFQCFPDDPDKIRKPDVCFVSRGRLPGERPPPGYIRVAP